MSDPESDVDQVDQDEIDQEEPASQPLLSRGVKAALVPFLVIALLLILPARVSTGPFRGLDVRSVHESAKKAKVSKRALIRHCKHPSGGLAKGAPCRVVIPAIGVDAVVIKLGLRSNGTLEVPTIYSQTGWWSGGPKPGELGSTVIVGNVDSRNGPAVFYKLKQLKAGDTVTVARVKARPVRYVIEDIGEWQKSNFPSEIVYGASPLSEIRLITCGGAFNRSTGHYENNIIAFGRLIGGAR